MRSVANVAAIMLAAVVFPQRAPGQFIQNYGSQCFVGSFTACASLEVSWQHRLNPFGGQETLLEFRLSNRQGSPGFTYGGHTALSLVEIFGYETNTILPGSFHALAPTGRLEGNAGGYVEPASTIWDQNARFFQLVNYGGAPYPLFGCNPSPVIDNDPFFDGLGGPSFTCYQGWFIYSVVMPGTINITDDTRYQLYFTNWNLDPIPGGPGGNCFVGETCVAAVPEPATLTLLGTGLASLALARRRRRKR